jgi:hypothetical protein
MPRDFALQQTDREWLYTKAAEARVTATFMREAWMRRELIEIADRFEFLAAHAGKPQELAAGRA